MPVSSSFRDVDIPEGDMWSFVLGSKKSFAPSQVIYQSATDEGRRYTFNDVRAAATSFGEGLYSQYSWRKCEVVAIYAPNDVDYGAIIYGTFYAGGVISPSNPGYTANELAYQLKNAEAKVLVTAASHFETALAAAKMSGISQDNILLLGDKPAGGIRHWTQVQRSPGQAMRGRAKLNPREDLAFLVYSSGTTGLPKGVMLTHQNVIADLCLITGAVGHWYSSKNDKILGVLPFFHIYGLVGLVNQCLLRGIQMVVVSNYTFENFLQLVEKHKITFTYVAPPVIVRLAYDPLVNKYNLKSLRMITCGAAPLTVEVIQQTYQRLGVGINQAYGLSETSPMTHTQPWDEWESSAGSVGKMFPNMTGKLVSPEGEEVAPGSVGELWLAGPNVFKGYWKNPEATKASIAEVDGLRYLKTGDIGYEDKNRNFFITDRVKDLIKYKGFQVAPTELEGKLMDHPQIQDVAIIGIFDNSAHTEVPRAYIVHSQRKGKGSNKNTGVPEDSDSKKKAQEIMSWLASRVANHKQLRGGVRFLDEIPKSAAGKILRNDLKKMAKLETQAQKPKL